MEICGLKETKVGSAYLSNDPTWPGQVFKVVDQEEVTRFGQPNRLLTVERWAYWSPMNEVGVVWNHMETMRMWLYTGSEYALGETVPEELMEELV